MCCPLVRPQNIKPKVDRCVTRPWIRRPTELSPNGNLWPPELHLEEEGKTDVQIELGIELPRLHWAIASWVHFCGGRQIPLCSQTPEQARCRMTNEVKTTRVKMIGQLHQLWSGSGLLGILPC